MFTNYQTTLVFKKANTWGTPVIVDKYLLILNEDILKERINVNDLSLNQDFIECLSLGNIECKGTFETYLHYFPGDINNSLLHLLFFSMGKTDLTILPLGTKRTFELTKNLNGLFSTLVIDKITSIHEMPTVKFIGFRIYGNIGELLKIQFLIVTNNRNINELINTRLIVNSLALKQINESENLNPLSLNFASFLVTPYGSSVFTEYGISSIDLIFKRNYDLDFVAGNNNETLEPLVYNEDLIELDIIMNYYDSKKFIEDFDLENILTAKLEIIAKELIVNLRYSFKINFNKMVLINESDIINNSGLQPLTLKFALLDDDQNGKQPFDIEIISNSIEIIN